MPLLTELFTPPELIDTLWNVNLLPPQYHEGRNIELIDTLWNVN